MFIFTAKSCPHFQYMLRICHNYGLYLLPGLVLTFNICYIYVTTMVYIYCQVLSSLSIYATYMSQLWFIYTLPSLVLTFNMLYVMIKVAEVTIHVFTDKS